MEKNWDIHKSIVNGHHMKHVQQTIDADYKAHLRHREVVRENAEQMRQKKSASQRTPNLHNIHSARNYSKPWQNGMTTRTEMPAVSGLEEKQRREQKYKCKVTKLPAIKKDKAILRKKTVNNPSMTYQGNKLITAKNLKQLKKKGVTNGAINSLNSIQHPYEEHKMVISDHVDHHDLASFSPLNSQELTEEPQITRRQSTFSEPEDRQTQRNINEDDDRFDDNNLSYVSDIALPVLVPISAQASNNPLHIDYTDEDSNDSDEEHPRQDMLHHGTSHGFDIVSTENSSYFERNNIQSLQTSRRFHSPTMTETADQSPNFPRNLRDIVEVPRINESITLSQNSEISSTTNMSSTSPNITLLHENLNLVFHTFSMQRQLERRNLENIRPILLNKDDEKPKTDPEKLKKLQESLLQEDSEEEGDICRICLMGGETTENYLIAPCQCSGSLKYVHSECLKKWLLAKIKSGAELNTVRTCEMCKQTVECEIEGFNLSEHYRKHQETQATLNPSLYLVLLLHLYQQRYEELLQLSQTRDRVSELSRRFLHVNLGRREHSRNNEQDS